MNSRAVTLSLVFGLFAVFMVQSYVESIEETNLKKYGTEVLVVAAKEDIKEMQTIDETLLVVKPIPKEFLMPSAVFFDGPKKKENANRDLNALAGMVAIVPVKKGSQLSYNMLREPNIRTGLSPEITPGKRAITVPVNEISGVGKLVKPGDRVDIIGVFEGTARGVLLSRTVIQDVVVLAVGRNVTNNIPRRIDTSTISGKPRFKSLAEYDGFTSVTLEVEPKVAQTLALLTATNQRRLFLTLRNNDDTEVKGMSGLTISDIVPPSDLSRINRAPTNQRARGRRR